MKKIDEQPNDNAPIMTNAFTVRVRRSNPLWERKIAYQIRAHPGAARRRRWFLIQPDGKSNILRTVEDADGGGC